MQRWPIVCWLVALGCGDNEQLAVGPPLARAELLFVGAHPDDDMIFMQPELVRALQSTSVTTVYVTTGDPSSGSNSRHLLSAARTAYARMVGSSDWDCGYVALTHGPVQHCRLRDRPVSLFALDLPDGGIPGEHPESLLHLVDGTVASLQVMGPIGGTATMDSTIELVAEVVVATAPTEIHAMELASTHGRDHSSHMFSSSFLLWASARIGYGGVVTWHRGYNVATEPVTLDSDDYAAAANMLGYYEACADRCGPCGSSCTTLNPAHATWLQRQYASTRIIEAAGLLAVGDQCVTASAALADCASAAPVELDDTGHLRIGGMCIASAPGDAVVLETCAPTAAQYWVFDDEGYLWNGSPPDASGEMAYDHVRCLNGAGQLTAPICGERLQPRWQFR